MPLDLGAIQASIRINVQQFMDGLRDAKAMGQRTAAELAKTLTTTVHVDTRALTTGLAQAQAQVNAFTAHPPQLDLEFDITEAQQGAFGFMRNLDEIQKGAQRVADAAAPVQRTWGQTLRATLQRLWDTAKTGTRDLVAGFRQATQGARATGEAGERAGHQGASGFSRFGAQVASTAKGFVLAQVGLGSVEQALQRLLGVFTQIKDEVSEDEQASFQLARALIVGGQAAGRTWNELTGEFDAQEKRLHSLSEQTGIATRNLSVFANRAVEAGIPLEHAEQQVALIARGISGMMGPTERVNALTSEMREIYSGTTENVNWLKRRIGEVHLAEMQRLNALGRYIEAEDLLRAKLKITVQEEESRRKSVIGVGDAYRNMVDQMLSGAAGAQFAEELKGILGAITNDLRAHGPLWQAITTLIQTGTEAMRAFKRGLDEIAAVTNRLSAPQKQMKTEWEAYKADVRAFLADPWAGVTRGAWSWWEDPFSTGREALPEPPPQPEPSVPGTQGRPPIPEVKPTVGELAEEARNATQLTLAQLQAFKDQALTQSQIVKWQKDGAVAQQRAVASAQHGLELAQAQGEALRSQAQLHGDAVQQAQAEGEAKQLTLDAQRQLLQTQLAWNQALLPMIEADITKSALEQETARQQVAGLETALQGLDVQTRALALDTQRATVQARLTVLTEQAQQAAERTQAVGERGLAAMRLTGASALAMLQREAGLRDQALADQQAALQLRMQQLSAAGALSQTERDQLTRAIAILDIKRDTNQAESTLSQLTTAAALASEQLRVAEERRSLALQRQMDLEESRLELQQMYLRTLDLPAGQEQLQLTLLQAESKQRQTTAQIQEAQHQATANALQLQTALLGKSGDQQDILVRQYVNAQEALGNTVTRLEQQRVILEETKRIAIELEQSRPFKELASDLVQSAQRFVDTIVDGTATMKEALQGLLKDAAKSFLDAGLKPLWEQMQRGLAGGLQRLLTGEGPGAAEMSPEAQALMHAGTTLDTAGSDLALATAGLETTSGQLQLASTELRTAAQALLTRPQTPAGLPTAGLPTGAAPVAMTGLPANLAPWADEVGTVARQLGVDPLLVLAVMQQESGGKAHATSPAGAMGLMQLMPATARGLGVTNPYDPAQNIAGGTKYLDQLLDRYSGNVVKALAAYNWGMGHVERQGLGQMPAETEAYVQKVLATYAKLQGSAPRVEPLAAAMETSLTQLTDQAGSGFERMTSEFLGVNTQMASVTQGLQPVGPALSQAAMELQAAAGAMAAGGMGGRAAGGALTAAEAEMAQYLEGGALEDVIGGAADTAAESTEAWLNEYSSMITAGIGLAMTGLSSLLRDTSAQVTSLGDTAADSITRSQDHTRGLVAGEQNIAVQQISQELSKAMRGTNEILLRIEQVLRGQGSAPAPVQVAGTGGSYGIAIETMSGARV